MGNGKRERERERQTEREKQRLMTLCEIRVIIRFDTSNVIILYSILLITYKFK